MAGSMLFNQIERVISVRESAEILRRSALLIVEQSHYDG